MGFFPTWQHLLNCRKKFLLLYIAYDMILIDNTKFKLKINQTLTREIIFSIITKNEILFNNSKIILEIKLENFIISFFDIYTTI